jgi:hypothetical protein
MPLAPPLSSREVRRTSKEALEAVQSLGAVVNGNATLLNQYGERLSLLRTAHELHVKRLNLVPDAGSTFWQRLRWLVRGA